MKSESKQYKRNRRRMRVRAVVSGTPERPRLNIFRSLTGVTAQLIDDTTGRTLAHVSTKRDIDKKQDAGERTGKVANGYRLGIALAKKAKEKGIEAAVFDRAGYPYHGRVKALAEGARDGGLVL